MARPRPCPHALGPAGTDAERFDGACAYVELDADDEKGREGNSVMIRAHLGADVRAWFADKLAPNRDIAPGCRPVTLILYLQDSLSRMRTPRNGFNQNG